MKIISIHDNEGESIDSITVVTDELYNEELYGKHLFTCLSLSETASGFSQFGSCTLGKHLGKKVSFESLSEELQNHIATRIFGDE